MFYVHGVNVETADINAVHMNNTLQSRHPILDLLNHARIYLQINNTTTRVI